ncbi:hypothetical protein BCV71DRAFT_44073 [Rhizopus microsporus]|uniref:Uncharacterized protein n=1 Tax=Rhizopus microsporus TaxID=58291 RepID=A0A1X0RS10_RHIZD|nr:hypothetical protein BCV71DRAFT_44073 [Rhizopus microsporus]
MFFIKTKKTRVVSCSKLVVTLKSKARAQPRFFIVLSNFTLVVPTITYQHDLPLSMKQQADYQQESLKRDIRSSKTRHF